MVDDRQVECKEPSFTSHYHIDHRPIAAYGNWGDLAVRDILYSLPPPRIEQRTAAHWVDCAIT